MKKLLTLIAVFAASLTFFANAEWRKSQVNFADPYVLLDGDYYYAYGTNHGDGIEVWRSKDLIGWEYKGLALHKDNCTEKQWFWAPEVYHKNGKYYMYFSANEHLFVATADSPTGPFYQQGGYQVQNILGSEKCIDSHVFFDDDGSAWLFFVRFTDGNCIWSCKLSGDLITPVSGTLKKCINVTQSWEQVLGRVTEGPNVVKHNGIYYLTYSANDYTSHSYAVGYATSSSIGSGSWSKYSGNPILKNMEDLVGCGHHTLFYDKNGNFKIAYHAHYSTSSIHPRQLYIGDMYFNGNTLQFNYGSQSLRPLGATEALSYMTERWNVSEKRGNVNSKSYDPRKIRNIAYQNGKLYCVYDNSSIKILNAEDGEEIGTLKEGDICKGGTYKFCDVKCFDGHIVACNLAVAGQEFRVYTWDSDNAEPRLFMNTTDLHGFARMGDCMEIAPNGAWENNFWLNFINDDGSTTRLVEFKYNGSGWENYNWTVTTDGTNQFKTGGTARAYPNGGVWWIDGLASNPAFFTINNGKLQRNFELTDVGTWGSSHHEFNFRGFKYAVNLKFDDRLKGRARIEMDDAGDYGHTTWLGEFPSDGLSSTTKNANGTGDVIVDTDGNNYVRIFVCSSEQGLACFAQGDVPSYKHTIPGDFNLVEKWNCSQNANTLYSKGYDASKINNFCYANGKLYCVYDHKYIKALDAQTGEFLGDLPLGSIVSGGTYALSDIKFVDGRLIACNYAKAGETLKFYAWESDMMGPYLLYSTNDLMGANALGKCMEPARDASFSKDIWLGFGEDDGTKTTIYEFHRNINGEWEGKTTRVKYDANTELRMGDNCRVYPWGGPFWIDGNDGLPIHVSYNADAGCLAKYCEVQTGDSWGASHKEQYWGSVMYAANMRFDDKKNGRIRLISNDSGEYSATTLIGEYPAAGLGSSPCESGAGDIIIKSNGTNAFEAWVFAEGQGIAYFAYGLVLRVEPTPAGAFKPVEKWNFSQQRGNATSMGYDATKIRNFGYQNGKLYCIYNNSEIKVLNAQTGEDYGNLKLGSIVKGGTLTLSDVKCFQGHIVACNLAKKGEELRIYAWDDDKAEPYLLYNTNDLQNCTSLGDAMDVAVNCNYDTDLWINFCCDNGSATYVVELNRNSSGVWNKYHRDLTTDGSAYFNVGNNARAYPNGGVWWITGNNIQPNLCSWSNGYPSPIKIRYPHNLGETWGGSYHEFMFDNHLYAVVPQFDDRVGSDVSSFYKGAKMRFDIIAVADHSTLYNRGSYPADGLGSAQNTDCTTDVMINTDNKYFVEAWIFSTNQGIAYYTFGNVPEQNPDPVEILTPHISASTSELALSCFFTSEDNQEISIVGSKLTDNIQIDITGDDADCFYVSSASLPASGGSINVKYSPTEIGSHSAQLVLSSAGAPDVTVSLKGTAKTPTKFDDNITELTEMWTNT
ncbi:MAG: family 43 glycosylhydrolase, partial [Muribaculaceae bacterium]